MTNDVLQREGHHRPLHGMIIIGNRGGGEVGEVVVCSDDIHDVRGIAKVPGDAVEPGVHMVGGAGQLSEAGRLMGVVKKRAPDLDDRRRGIEEGNRVQHGLRRRVNGRDAVIEPVVNVETVSAFIQRQSGRALTDVDDRVGSRAGALGIDDDEIVRSHAGDIPARSVGGPNDAARIAHGHHYLVRGNLSRRVIKMRIQVGQGVRQHDRIDLARLARMKTLSNTG